MLENAEPPAVEELEFDDQNVTEIAGEIAGFGKSAPLANA